MTVATNQQAGQSTARRRVVITGFGMITPLGADATTTFARAAAGESGISELTAFPAAGLPSRVAGQVDDAWLVADWRGLDPARRGRTLALLFAAADEAAAHAELAAVARRERIGVVIGGHGENPELADLTRLHAAADGSSRWHPAALAAALGGAEHQFERRKADLSAALLARRLDGRGPCLAVASACAAGAQAIGEAALMIRDGAADVVVAGGAESNLNFAGFVGFVLLRAVVERWDSPATASRPFDRRRNGFVVAEGAGVVVLEALDHARARGAAILGEVLGYGDSADAHRLTDPRPDGHGAVLAMTAALADAGLDAAAVEAVNAHATSTVQGDLSEARALRTVLGGRADSVPVSATKSMTGHTIAAAGAIEAILTLQGLASATLLPTVNLEQPDPRCALAVVAHHARRQEHRVALSNSFGFGGQNACLCLGRWDAAG